MTRRPFRIALMAVAAVIVLAVGAGAVFLARFDPNAYKPQIIEAVKRATGRDLTLNGKIGLKFSLTPTIRVEDVAFSNPPGFSRPQMATLQSMELELGLLPLLSSSVEIDRLVLIHPDILLETDAAGHPNWQMTPEVTPAAPAAPQAPGPTVKAKTATISAESIRILDGTVAYRDDASGKVTTLGLPRLDAKAVSPDAPLHIEADGNYNGTAFNLVADKGGPLAALSSLTLHVGAVDLGAQMPGLRLDHLDINAPAADQPVKVGFAGKLDNAPVTLAATLGPLALLMPDAKPAPFPVDATLQAAGATITAKGTVTDARAMTGASIALAAQIPDLSALSPLARHPLPALKTVAFQGTLTDASGGFRNGAALHGVSLTSPDGDLTGDAAISLGARDSLTAALKSSRIDLDALQAAVDKAPAVAASPPPAGAKAPPPPPKRSDRLFSDEPIPFDLLRTADADLTLAVADLHTGGADYKAIDTHAVVKGGKLTVDPFAADLPGGHMSGTASADATQASPSVHVTLHAPGLALKPILAALHQPSFATGNLEVYADMHGTGDSPHAIASSLDGSLGLAMAGGTIDSHLLGGLLGNVMETLNGLALVGKGGSSDVKCLGVRMNARHGVGTFRSLALSSSLLTMTGGGSVNLGAETLALELRPQARVAGTEVEIPVNVNGPIRNPAVKVNKVGAAESNAGSVAGAVIGNATPLGIVAGLLGGDKLLGGGTADICTPALAAARGQAVPAAAPAPAKAAEPSTSNPAAVLKNLFR